MRCHDGNVPELVGDWGSRLNADVGFGVEIKCEGAGRCRFKRIAIAAAIE